MIETHTSISKRILAGLFAMLMVLTLVPYTALKASAADVSGFTFLVQHADGTPVEGAEVTVGSVYLTSDANKEHILEDGEGNDITLTGTSDENGYVSFPEIDALVTLPDSSTQDITLVYTISKDGYKSVVEKTIDVTSTNINTSFDVTLLKVITDVFNVEGKTLTSTGAPQELVAVTPGNGVDASQYAITYSVNDDPESAAVPTAKDVGEYDVKVIIRSNDTNYEAKEIDVTAKIVDTFLVTVTPVADFTYDGEEHQLVTLGNELQDGDVVSFECDNNNATVSEGKIYATNAGTYNITVTVERDGYADFVSDEKTVVIERADLNISVTGATGLKYNGEDQQLITSVTGLEDIDENNIHWYIDSSNEAKQGYENVKGLAVGTYEIYLEVEETDNYNAYTKTKVASVEIGLGDIDLNSLDELDVKPVADDVNYYEENTPKALLESATVNDGYKLWFAIDDNTGDANIPDVANSSLWTDDINAVTAIEAGEYHIYVKVTKDSYNDKLVDIEACFPVKAVINKAQQDSLTFTSGYEDKGSTTILFSETIADNSYNFSAEHGTKTTGKTITYDIESAIEGVSLDSNTKIDGNGVLTITAPGAIRVIATCDGNESYEPVTSEHIVIVTANVDLVKFENASIDYVFGTNSNVVSTQIATVGENDNKDLSYNIIDAPYLSVDKSGKVTVNDMLGLATDIQTAENGKLSVIVQVEKPEKWEQVKTWVKDGLIWKKEKINTLMSPAASSTYTLNISFEKLPELQENENYYEVEIQKDVADNPTNVNAAGWFKSAVTVKNPPAGYTMSTSVNGTFGSNVTFSDNGTHARYVYLKNTETGGITNKIAVKYNKENLKIDTEAPVVTKIEYAKTPTDTFLEVITLGFYNPSVTIKFTAEDATSGVKEFNWKYTKADGVSTSILSEKTPTDEDDFTFVDEGNGVYSATLTLKAKEAEQYRGYIAVTAIDNAGNVSDTVTDDGNVFVVDTIRPELSVSYNTSDNEAYPDFYNKDVVFTLIATEANFYEEVIGEDVIVKVKKDGADYAVTPDWEPFVENNETVDDKYQGTFTLKDNGVYDVTVTYKDKSTNDAIITDGKDCKGTITTDESSNTTTYTKSFTIDKEAPIVSIEYYSDLQTREQKTIFKVTEHNFTAKGVTVTGSAVDSKNTTVDFDAEALTAILQKAEWTQNGNTYTYEYDGYINGNYKLILTCEDKATNSTTSEEKAFTIDRGAPLITSIEYAKSPTDEFLEKITLGFYNPSVTLKFTATDDTTAVKSFNWTYTREKDASTSILEKKTGTLDDITDNGDGTYTATLTLPFEDVEDQYRGHITVTAVDTYGNECDEVSDTGNVFVVDTISPELSVTYTEPTVKEDAEGNTDKVDFYNKDVEFTLNATEANFYEEVIGEDVIVEVKKDGADYAVAPVWASVVDENKKAVVDKYEGKFKLTEDGDYVITITYKDKSTNDANITNGEDCNGEITTSTDENGVKTTTYTKSFTIDQTAPKIESVVYSNTDVKSTKDGRDYYAEKQTATVTITEHNFDETGVNFIVKATDASGATITSLDRTINGKDLEWTVDANNSDKYIVTLPFEDDANYTFDIECVDKATNAIKDYTADEFTVDKTAPNEDSLKVTYIESKTGKAAEVISLGYFQNKVKVIITAEDATAGVNAFTYGYRNAEGVSQVNGELLDQKLKEADVKIEGNKTTATFTIPKSALGKGTQFNGNVEFIAIDRSGNQTAKTDENRIIVDNIAPVANVTFSDPVNTVGDISYYAGDINATITINEANFDAKDYKVVLTKDGVVDNISTDVKWTHESVDVHKGTFTIKADGDYFVELSGADKSGNNLKTYTSKQLTIDTDIKEPTFSINGAAKSGIGGAYKGDISVSFNYEDENFDNAEIKLVKTSLNSVEDVTSKYINANNEEKGGSGSFSIPAEVANDGIYTLTVNMNDKAKHTSSAELKFTVNRYGSVYEYSDYLISLIKDGGQYVTIKDGATAAITEDIVITEYNATPILSDSLKVLITRDGEVIEADYTTTPSNLDSATIGNSGWYQYVYTIKASNFAEDGVYKISLVSQYSANDAENNESTSVPENSIDSEGNEIVDTMTFTVDTKAPEIRNITNLEKSYIDADSVEVNYSIVDVGGLKSIEVIVNGKAVAEITDFKENLFSFDGSFTLKADTKEQTVQIIVTDLAGNVTDTSSEAFDTQGLYTFNPNVTVSTNIFVLWYANTPLFWGSIGGGVGVIGVAAVGVPKIRVRLRKRK